MPQHLDITIPPRPVLTRRQRELVKQLHPSGRFVSGADLRVALRLQAVGVVHVEDQGARFASLTHLGVDLATETATQRAAATSALLGVYVEDQLGDALVRRAIRTGGIVAGVWPSIGWKSGHGPVVVGYAWRVEPADGGDADGGLILVTRPGREGLAEARIDARAAADAAAVRMGWAFLPCPVGGCTESAGHIGRHQIVSRAA